MPREQEFRWDQVNLYSVYELDVVFPWNSIPFHFFPPAFFLSSQIFAFPLITFSL